MDIQVAVLCDAATDSAGKLNVLGTFDTINASQMPAVHPQCSIALRFVFNKSEEGNHELVLNFVNEDSKPVMGEIRLPVEVVVPDDSFFISRNFIVNIQRLALETAGFYSFNLVLDGELRGSIPLLVKKVGELKH